MLVPPAFWERLRSQAASGDAIWARWLPADAFAILGQPAASSGTDRAETTAASWPDALFPRLVATVDRALRDALAQRLFLRDAGTGGDPAWHAHDLRAGVFVFSRAPPAQGAPAVGELLDWFRTRIIRPGSLADPQRVRHGLLRSRVRRYASFDARVRRFGLSGAEAGASLPRLVEPDRWGFPAGACWVDPTQVQGEAFGGPAVARALEDDLRRLADLLRNLPVLAGLLGRHAIEDACASALEARFDCWRAFVRFDAAYEAAVHGSASAAADWGPALDRVMDAQEACDVEYERRQLLIDAHLRNRLRGNLRGLLGDSRPPPWWLGPPGP